MKKNIFSYGLLFILIGCIMGLPVDSLGASNEEFDAATAKLEKTVEAITALEQKKKELQDEYKKLELEAKEWNKNKKFSKQNVEGATELQNDIEQDMAKNKKQQTELDQKKKELLATKEKLEEQRKASIPPPPWETHKPAAPNDFATKRIQARENYLWYEKFGPTEEGRAKARDIYVKEMAKIAKEEEKAEKEKKAKKAEKEKKAEELKKPKKVESPKKVEGKTQQTASPSEPTPDSGKETQAEIWDLGDKPPKTAFLTDAEVKMKTDMFKENPYGFHVIKTKDGKVIDVVANKHPDSDSPPVGYITIGKGNDAKTTAYTYEETTQYTGDVITKGVSDKLVSKKEYNPLNDPNLNVKPPVDLNKVNALANNLKAQFPGSKGSDKDSGVNGGGNYPIEQPKSYKKGPIGKTTPPTQAHNKPKNNPGTDGTTPYTPQQKNEDKGVGEGAKRTEKSWKQSEAYKKFQTERKKVYSWYNKNSKQDSGFVQNWYNSAMSHLNKAEDLAYKNYLAGAAKLSFPVINYPKKVPRTFSTKAADIGLGKGSEPRVRNLPVKVPSWGKQLIVKVEHGYDDTGDRKMEVLIYNPNGEQLAHRFLGSRGWEDVSVTARNTGVYRVIFRDKDTKTGGDFPGNGITYKLEINGFEYK